MGGIKMHEVSIQDYLNLLEELWTNVCTQDNGMTISERTRVLNRLVDIRDLLEEIALDIELREEEKGK
jgi:hypothetical protein